MGNISFNQHFSKLHIYARFCSIKPRDQSISSIHCVKIDKKNKMYKSHYSKGIPPSSTVIVIIIYNEECSAVCLKANQHKFLNVKQTFNTYLKRNEMFKMLLSINNLLSQSQKYFSTCHGKYIYLSFNKGRIKAVLKPLVSGVAQHHSLQIFR